MKQSNLFFAHSGGPTPVVNTIASGVIQEAQKNPLINRIFIGRNGILGAIKNELYDVTDLSDEQLKQLSHTPASAFGSCRYKLKHWQDNDGDYQSIIQTFDQHNISYFLYNGGNDSQDTTLQISNYASHLGYSLKCIGIPKTIDNDLPLTDCCPGYASAAKYLATSILEASLDTTSMKETSTKVFILETMGRNAGWLAAATGIAQHHNPHLGPHIILLPERTFNLENFLSNVDNCIKKNGFCIIAASEGIKEPSGKLYAQSDLKDTFGHPQLGGVAPKLASAVQNNLKVKVHWAVADYLQRSAAHLTSKTDYDHACQLAISAVNHITLGEHGSMMAIERLKTSPYQWGINPVPLSLVANQEKLLPNIFIREDGLHITSDFIQYLIPLIEGEVYPNYHQGIPSYFNSNNIHLVKNSYVK
ncbi:MAG TPA: 6-phosphofructokinase [Gammaproteobacteria bacterium]|nr:6-phosphofructokinase [Gammaproteobacteria bacterium]